MKFCHERYTDLIQATIVMGIEFLTEYFKTGLGYIVQSILHVQLCEALQNQCVNCNIPFGKLPLVCRILKGILNIRPVL